MIDIPRFSLDMPAINKYAHDTAELFAFSVCPGLLAPGYPVCQSFFMVKRQRPDDHLKITSKLVSVYLTHVVNLGIFTHDLQLLA